MKASDKAKAAHEDLHERDLIAQQLAGRAFIRFDRKIDYDAWVAATAADGKPCMTSVTLREKMRHPEKLTIEELQALSRALGARLSVLIEGAAE